jgi:ATP-dependent helicase/nuclease subunit A
VSLLSVLRSPVYGFDPDLLSRLRSRCPKGDIYDCVEQGAREGEARCARFLRELEELRLLMGDLSCAQLLWHLYDQVGLLGLFGAMSGGERRQENLLSFYDFAQGFEGQGHRGLFAFVAQLRRMAEQGKDVGGSRAAGSGGVQIMSVHKSKGLEFPVVVLAGLNRSFNTSDEREPLLFHPKLGVGPKLLDRELRIEVPTLARTAVQLKLERERRAEELRLLYVAMTRARERLVMVMSFRKAFQDLNKLLEQASPRPEPELLSLQGSVGRWMLLPILCRSDAGALWRESRPETVIQPEDSWDIRLVQADESCFAPSEKIEEQQAAAPAPEDADLLRGLNWRYPGQELALLPSKVTATQLKGRQLDEEAAEDAPRDLLPLEFRRPDFAQKGRKLTAAQAGSAVHAVMEHIDLNRAADPAQVGEEIDRLVQQGHLTAEQGAVVRPAEVALFWASELGRAAAASPALRREFKFSILAPAGDFYPGTAEGEQVLLQGVVDCCFEDGDGMTVVDFKSDRVKAGEESTAAQQYRPQVEVYARALEQIFHIPVRRRVVWFLRTGNGIEIQ